MNWLNYYETGSILLWIGETIIWLCLSLGKGKEVKQSKRVEVWNSEREKKRKRMERRGGAVQMWNNEETWMQMCVCVSLCFA